MGPFSNNTPPPVPRPDNRSTLPVPDVETPSQTVVFDGDNDFGGGTKKWFTVTLIIAGIMALVAIIVFGVYVYVTNTPNYMLGAAVSNLASSDGEAGNITFTSKIGSKEIKTDGDFVAYSDPTNTKQGQVAVSLGQGAARVSAMARVFESGSYVETAGLGNLGRLIKAMGGNAARFTDDKLAQLNALDNRWYTITPAEMSDVDAIIPQHNVQGNITSGDVLALEQLYVKSPFVVVGQQLNDEQVNGVNSMHLGLRIDRTKLGDYLQAVKDAHLAAVTVTDNDIRTVRALSDLDKVQIEVWISRSDHAFQQFKVVAPNGTDTTLVTLKSEIVALKRQSVVRPGDTESLVKLVQGLSDVAPFK